nr:MAG TPA: minor capsid protein [Caudoviricetes sp.]
MLSEQQLEIIADALTPLFQYLEHEVIVDIARRIAKTLTYTRTAELQAMSMEQLGYSPARIRKEAMKLLTSDPAYRKAVAKNTLEYKREIRKTINQITKEAYKANDEIVANAGNMSWIDDLSVWKSAGKDLTDNSFLQQLVTAFSVQTAGELKNMTQSTGFKVMSGYEGIENAYRRELDKAVVKICSGTFSQDKVVRDVVHDLSQSGLRSVDFASGYSMQLDTAVRGALRTGCHQLAGKVQDQNIEQTGENLVYVSKHWGARNTGVGHANHEQWQGRVYYIKEGEDCREEAKRIGQDYITELWRATGYSVDGAHENDPTGLYGYNCRHNHHVWFEGVSSFPKDSPEPKPVTINGKTYDYYAMTQKMRAMERNIRALKREKEALATLGMDTREINARIKSKRAEYKEFCNACGVPEKTSRLRYECGTADLKKTRAWNGFEVSVAPIKNLESPKEKRIDFGSVKNVKFEKNVDVTHISSADIQKIKDTISMLGEEYDIKLDTFGVGNYVDSKYINVPLFFHAVEDGEMYRSSLILNNASPFWYDKEFQKKILASGYFAGNTIEDFVRHEMAHVITFQGCKTVKEYLELEATIHPLYTNGVSMYSWESKDGTETIAEAFVKLRNGGRVNKDAAMLVNRYVEVWKK